MLFRPAALAFAVGMAVPAMALEDGFRGRPEGYAMGAALEVGINGDITVGSQRFDWDSNQRYNLTFRQRMRPDGRAVPMGGIDIGWLDAVADVPVGDLDASGLMLGLTGAVELHLREDHDFRSVGFALIPYLRGGIGWQSTRAYNVVEGDYSLNSSVDSGRFELGCGFDISLRIRRLEVLAGLGAQVWTVGTPAWRATEISSGDEVVVLRSVSGDDTFARLQVLFRM